MVRVREYINQYGYLVDTSLCCYMSKLCLNLKDNLNSLLISAFVAWITFLDEHILKIVKSIKPPNSSTPQQLSL